LARAVVSGAMAFDTAMASSYSENDLREYMKVAANELNRL
jgi:hypothetical protein